MNRRETTKSQREQIITLHLANIPSRQISQQLNIKKRTVNKWIKRHRERGNIGNIARRGAPRRTTEEQDQLIITRAQEKPLTNCVDIKKQLNLPVGVQTVRKRLLAAGIHHRTPASEPNHKMVEPATKVSEDGPQTKRRKTNEHEQSPDRDATNTSKSSSHSQNSEASAAHANSSDNEEQEDFTSFDSFKILRVLSSMEEEKKVVVEGQFPGKEGSAVVLLEKTAFDLEKLGDVMCSVTTMKKVLHNDIYYTKKAFTTLELSAMNATIIYPAREDHIKKYSRQLSTFIDETYTMYQEVTGPYIKFLPGTKQWIYNILDHKSEADRIVFEDPDPVNGFILLPDLKWPGDNMDCLYLQAIVRRKDIGSIRDLRGEHLPLLKNLREKGTLAIKEKYGVAAEKLRIYFHYQPSYYHLHCHFTALSYNAPGIWAGKAHLLSHVIGNIELCEDYYQKAVIPFTIKNNHPLLEKFVEKEYISKPNSS